VSLAIPRLGLVLALLAVSAAACSSTATAVPTLESGGSGATAGPIESAGVTLPGTDPACQQMQEPISELGQVEAALRAGSMSDAAAEGAVLGIQQLLVSVAEQAGPQTQIGLAIQGLVGALGDLGVVLNQNAGIDVVNPQLQKVDTALIGRASACAAAG
jgi:hypothetical protein